MPRQTRRGRRGVLLLIVLALLALFGMMGVSFVLLSGQSRRAAELSEQRAHSQDTPQQDLDRAARILMAGSQNPNCVIWPHGLLEHIYGNNPVMGTLLNIAPFGTSQQIYQVTLNNLTTGFTEPERRVGSVMTMLSGNAANSSFRIVGSVPNPTTPINGALHILVPPSSNVPAVGDNFIINSVPFSGMGIGFDATLTNINATTPNTSIGLLSLLDTDGVPFALRPNPVAPSFTSGGQDYAAQYGPPGSLGSNVDYTAPDLQNMFLALQLPDSTTMTTGTVVIPSFHRPELARYWVNWVDQQRNPATVPNFSVPATFGTVLQDINNTTNISNTQITNEIANWNLLRKITLRPLPIDHPYFTGSNPSFTGSVPQLPANADFMASGFNPLWNPTDAVAGNSSFSWDVDTDGDGIPDAIWLDLGYPVRADSQGRLYKPLFAIHCVDLDGRLNLNAHGCLNQVTSTYLSNPLSVPAAGLAFALASGTLPAQLPLPKGQGFGPGDVNLNVLFNNISDYQSLLYARYSDVRATAPPYGGTSYSPGLTNYDDWMSQNKSYDYWSDGVPQLLFNQAMGAYGNYNWWNPGSPLNAYGVPSDRKALGGVGIDPLGRPLFAQMGGTPTSNDIDYVDDPYEFDLSRKFAASADQPFTAGEFEPVLRQPDIDAGHLPSRLTQVSSSTLTQTSKRFKVTTDSWDLPCPGVALPSGLLYRLKQNPTVLKELQNLTDNAVWFPPQHLRDVLAVKMYLDLRSLPSTSSPLISSSSAAETLVRQNVTRLLPFELLAGRKMNLNRLFGIGQDTLQNGVPDTTAYVTHDAAGNLTFFGNLQGPWGQFVPLVNATGALITNPNVTFDPINGADVGNGALAPVATTGPTVGFGPPVPAPYAQAMARQLYARYLYILGLLAIDHQVVNPASPTQQEAARARLVAQWAVNVVDFRDRDSIMTPFEYDIAPFSPAYIKNPTGAAGDNSTWFVDGVIDNASNPPPGSDDNQAWRGLVWGCEKPELLITETLAFHDRRTQDLASDGGTTTSNPPDNHQDFDQQYRPEGSFFIEIYNASTCNVAGGGDTKTSDLYSGSNGGIMLNKLDAQSNTTPVWRLATYQSDYDWTKDYGSSSTDPYDPDNPSAVPERTVYFANPTNNTALINASGHVHFASSTNNGTLSLAPGRYAVIGPGAAPTGIGPNQAPSGGPFVTYIGMTSTQQFDPVKSRQIVLDPSQNNTNPPVANSPSVKVLNNSQAGGNDLPFAKNQLQTPLAVVVDMGVINGLPNPQPQRLSVSEPPNGYPDDYTGNEPIDQTTYMYQNSFVYPSPLDNPSPRAATAQGATNNPPYTSPNWRGGGIWSIILTNGTTPRFCYVHLQRLANPLLPWDPSRNPYRTVDSMVVDLTTFNGVYGPALAPGADIDKEGTPAPIIPAGNNNNSFAARERGEYSYLATGKNPPNNPWTQEDFSQNPQGHYAYFQDPNVPSAPVTGQMYTDPLNHSLGYLNCYLNRDSSGGFTLAGLGPRDNSDSTTGNTYMGGPRGQPSPWITWNNRPFLNEMELLAVPALGAKELLANQKRYKSVNNAYPFGKTLDVSLPNPNPYSNYYDSFSHTMDFFYQPTNLNPANWSEPQFDQFAYFHRLLEWVYVPSSFVDVETQADLNLGAPFSAPFNLIPDYREPGRINMNTVYSQDVLQGMLNYFPGLADSGSGTSLTTLWQRLYQNRQGGSSGNYAYTPPSSLGIDPNFATRFQRPFRSAGGRWLVTTTAGDTKLAQSDAELNRTVLCQDPVAIGRPLLAFDNSNVLTSSPVNSANLGYANDPDRNAFFRYNVLQKLGNVVTTRSNVFAVWITVGYFEALPAVAPTVPAGLTPQQAATIYPDGFTLGQELGYDTGNIIRHRAFYLIDRSIPVGFQRGQDINVDNTILKKSFIE